MVFFDQLLDRWERKERKRLNLQKYGNSRPSSQAPFHPGIVWAPGIPPYLPPLSSRQLSESRQCQARSGLEVPLSAPYASGLSILDGEYGDTDAEMFNPRIKMLRVDKSHEDSLEALDKLQSVAYLVAPVMQKFGLTVDCLMEMDLEKAEEAGVLAWNEGQGLEVRIKLRDPTQPEGWRSMDDLVDSILHELAHNEHRDRTFSLNPWVFGVSVLRHVSPHDSLVPFSHVC